MDEITEDDYQMGVHRLISPMPWELPPQDNAYLQPLVDATVFTYVNWTEAQPIRAQQLVKVSEGA